MRMGNLPVAQAGARTRPGAVGRPRQTRPFLAHRGAPESRRRPHVSAGRGRHARYTRHPQMSTLVQEQFGRNAAGYLTSKPHAQGKSLDRLIALTKPQRDWRVLDVATGGGHVAYAFAPHVARVWATDITAEMIELVRGEAAKKGLSNLRTAYAKAEALSFDDASFDLVT